MAENASLNLENGNEEINSCGRETHKGETNVGSC